ncbi:MAG TPA: peptidoglycan DD-metalloendopeptidase family protein [Sphingomonadaceae bacterium]|nr:peptidoglycan DD-metalloendopeptidase family protein [Sphingomonadaceae bacterium]
MRRLLVIAIAAAAGLGVAAIGSVPSPQTALLRAQAEAREADRRVRELEGRARVFTDRADRARAAQAAALARLAAAEAGISAAQARIRIVDAQRRAQRVRLAREERPTATLLAGLQTLARRPPALALVQPGSLDDLIRTRALLASTMPAIAARTEGIRAQLAEATRIERQASLAARALRARQAELVGERRKLAALEAASLRERQTYVDAALGEGDRALALGEDARAIVSASRQRQIDASVASALVQLSGPVMRPGSAGQPRSGSRPRYLLPVDGRVLTGAGEISAAGVHARGVTLATEAQAEVVAPAAGRVVFAAPFRSYGRVVIIDHGAGWTTTITNLAALEVESGARVGRGDTLGTAAAQRPEVTVELRRGGRPVPIAPLL